MENGTKPPRIAVTGVGGGSGQSVLKALIDSSLLVDLYALDVTPMSAGIFWTPLTKSAVLPKPEKDINAWKVWLVKNGIDLLIPGSDRDLIPFAEVAQEWKEKHICRIAVSSPEMVALADDKSETALFLFKHSFPKPQSYWARGSATDLLKFFHGSGQGKVVIKPRHGAAKRGFQMVQDEEELLFYWNRVFDPIVQEYIEGDEYTCSIFFDIHHKPVAKFALKRWLRGGDTYRAQTVNEPKLNLFLDEVGEKLTTLKPFGPINVQLRERDGQFYVLEFNARCSGTTTIRAHFGYNEPEMLVRHICNREDISQPDTSSGFAFRVLGEMYLGGVDEARIMQIGSEETA